MGIARALMGRIELAEPHLAALSSATGETVNLAVVAGHEVEQIAQIDALFKADQIDCLSVQSTGENTFTKITNDILAAGIPVFTVGVESSGNEFSNFTQISHKEGLQAAFDAERADWEAKGEFARVERSPLTCPREWTAVLVSISPGAARQVRQAAPTVTPPSAAIPAMHSRDDKPVVTMSSTISTRAPLSMENPRRSASLPSTRSKKIEGTPSCRPIS